MSAPYVTSFIARTLNLQMVAFRRAPEEEAGTGKHRGPGCCWGEMSLRELADGRATPARVVGTEIIVSAIGTFGGLQEARCPGAADTRC